MDQTNWTAFFVSLVAILFLLSLFVGAILLVVRILGAYIE